MSLTPQERKFLQHLKDNGWTVLKWQTGGAIHPTVKALEDRGQVRLSKALSGPLGVWTGEYGAELTEAGESALKENA